MKSTPGPSPDPSSQTAKKRGYWLILGRAVLLVLGVSAVFGMVSQVGYAQILSAISRTAVWLPLILVLDLLWVAFEGCALLAIYGEERKRITCLSWLYVTLVHYTAFMLLPMGRAAAEVTRAALLKKQLDRDLVAVGAALMQSLTMVANGVTCLVAALFLRTLGHSGVLLAAVSTTAAVMSVLGIASYLVLRHVKVGGVLGRRFSRFAEAGPGFDHKLRETARRHWIALAICVWGRVLQTAQYGVIVLAVTGDLSLGSAWIAEGIQMTARTAGDFIPNQVGVTEGAFVYFRAALGLDHAPALAMTVALVARLSNLSVASLCAVASQLWPRSGRGQQSAR